MPEETIGEVGTPGADREWIAAQATLAIRQIVKTCGEPPPEMELEVQWREHELGEYPTIGLAWEDAMRGAPWDYIQKCQDALAIIDGAELPSGPLHRELEQEETDEEDTLVDLGGTVTACVLLIAVRRMEVPKFSLGRLQVLLCLARQQPHMNDRRAFRPWLSLPRHREGVSVLCSISQHKPRLLLA